MVIFYAVSLGFFDDIIIPHQNLQHPKRLYPLNTFKKKINPRPLECWYYLCTTVDI